jgi:hypothetical protein
MTKSRDGAGPDDLDAIFSRTTKQLRGAAKACRVGKGGVACAVLDVAAAIIENVQALSATVPVDDDVDQQEVKGSDGPSAKGTKAAATPLADTAPAQPAKVKKPTTPEDGHGDGV